MARTKSGRLWIKAGRPKLDPLLDPAHALSADEFKAMWVRMTQEQQNRVQDRASHECMWAVLNNWADLRIPVS